MFGADELLEGGSLTDGCVWSGTALGQHSQRGGYYPGLKVNCTVVLANLVIRVGVTCFVRGKGGGVFFC